MNYTLKNKYFLIFFIALVFRILFAKYSGVDRFGSDWGRYDYQSNNILLGQFNLETSLFITAPLYSYILAAFKYIFGQYYVHILEAMQIIFSAISAVYLAKTSFIIFEKEKISITCGIIYAIYPITIYFTHTFGQESIFQSLFIISIYFISKFLRCKIRIDLIIFSILFTLALLTKSHILLIIPFFIISILLNKGLGSSSILDVVIFIGIVLLLTLPYGVYNKVVNDVYVISSSGHGGHFLTGHNDDVYIYIVETPPLGSEEHTRIKNMDYKIFKELTQKLIGLSHAQKQSIYLNEGIKWMSENPIKTINLFIINLRDFLMPGFNIKHHPFNKWLFAFIMSVPVFLFAYVEIIKQSIKNYKHHLPVISIFLGMIIFSVVFYTQNRFRVITLEPFYVLYACSGFVSFYEYIRSKLNS
jgi:hypothetical protein